MKSLKLIFCLMFLAFGARANDVVATLPPQNIPVWDDFVTATDLPSFYAAMGGIATTNNAVATNGATSGQVYIFGSGWSPYSGGTGISTNYGGVVSLDGTIFINNLTNSYITNCVINGSFSGNGAGITSLSLSALPGTVMTNIISQTRRWSALWRAMWPCWRPIFCLLALEVADLGLRQISAARFT